MNIHILLRTCMLLVSFLSFDVVGDSITARLISSTPNRLCDTCYDVTYEVTSITVSRPIETNQLFGPTALASVSCPGGACSGSLTTPPSFGVKVDPGMDHNKLNTAIRSMLPRRSSDIINVPSWKPFLSICVAGWRQGGKYTMAACTEFDLSKPPVPTICDISIPNNLIDHGTVSPTSSPAPAQTTINVACRGGKGGYIVSVRGPSSNGDLNMGEVKSTLSIDGTVVRVSGPGKNYPNGGNRTMVLSSSLHLGNAAPATYQASATVVITLI
ncbi:Uncharacterised protein [Serratia quinivorans]|uniref:Uncharacterized protein n=1 Tax=Serratia quinivorans TaxID=137545 RepID=A0A380A968_9GAMM|nr:Uncharacterised protein [Serratia quinivorans]SUI75651.1 Uncharacterised protein [Serratia quinivorans]